MKTLVAYYSRKGYVKRGALKIASSLGADIYEIKPAERTAGFLGFMWCGRFGMHRWEMPIEEPSLDFEAYDKIVFCSPVWVFTVSAPMLAFVRRAAGRVKSADYVLYHFSFPMRYTRTIKKLDALLGVRHESFVSVVCQFGRELISRSL